MACIFSIFFFILLSMICVKSSHINLGSSLTPASSSGQAWPSSSGRFAFGFYPEGNGFRIGIWLVDKLNNNNNMVVWTANPNAPPVGPNAKLELNEAKGKLLLLTEQREERLVANATGSVSFASMLDSGNFVLYDKDNNTIWESFQYPTDTILQGQTLLSGGHLVSSLAENDHSIGRFHLKMQIDGNLVLYPLNSGDSPEDAYWDSGTFGTGFNLHLNSTGQLEIITNTELNPVETIDNDSSTIYRATLGYDGNFQVFSHIYDGNGGTTSSPKWSALKNPCDVKGLCAFNSYCTFNDNQPICLCLGGSDYVDRNQRTRGCQRNYSTAQCRGGKENARFYSITSMEKIVWEDVPYSREQMSEEECSTSCLEDCNCEAALYRDQLCMKQKLPLRYVRRDMQSQYVTFLKVGSRSLNGRNHSVGDDTSKQPAILIKNRKETVKILLLTITLLTFSCVSLATFGVFMNKFRALRYKRLSENGDLDMTGELTLQVFSYKELRRATNGFKEELGKGSFGAVYKGTLLKGSKRPIPIAVKRLEKLVEEGEKEFQAEMRAIGRTHHRNLVRLLGFCVEDSKRLLVYEYMSNGSLADLLFKPTTKQTDWSERLRIAIDVARGIFYLHEECETSVIHCDIKPQNILMDECWTAKISDFGLAKLLMLDQTRTYTGIRGTRGYLAPEWQKNVPISVKADVYSFGIVLLEIICCRRNLDMGVSHPEEVLLSTWIYRCFIENDLDRLVQGGEGIMEKNNVERMVKVALWCIQDEPALRPSMKNVVLMLEGMTDVYNPPCPTA